MFGIAANAMLLHSHAVAIGSVLYWMLHLQCRVLITHGAVVKVQIGLNVHDRKTSTSLPCKCPSYIHMPHRGGEQLYSEIIRRGYLWLGGDESCRHVGAAMYWEGKISGKHTASQA